MSSVGVGGIRPDGFGCHHRGIKIWENGCRGKKRHLRGAARASHPA